MTKDDFMSFGLSKQEVHSLPVVTKYEEQVYSILDNPFSILQTIYVDHDDQFLQGGRLQSETLKPFQVYEQVGTPQVDKHFHAYPLASSECLQVYWNGEVMFFSFQFSSKIPAAIFSFSLFHFS